MEQIRDLMAKLSSQHQQVVLDFAQYLAEKKSKPKRKKLRLDWAGGLAEFNLKNNFVQGLQADQLLMYKRQASDWEVRNSRLTTGSSGWRIAVAEPECSDPGQKFLGYFKFKIASASTIAFYLGCRLCDPKAMTAAEVGGNIINWQAVSF